MKRKIIRVAVSFLALVPFVQPGLAVAAPQTIGFVATNGPVELKCEAGHCKAEFSSFCLQEEHGPTDQRNTIFRNGYPKHPGNGIKVRWTSNFALTRNGFHDDGKPRTCRGIALNPTGSCARQKYHRSSRYNRKAYHVEAGRSGRRPNPQVKRT